MTFGDVVMRARGSRLGGCGVVVDAWPSVEPVGVTVMWEPLIYGCVSHHNVVDLELVELLEP